MQYDRFRLASWNGTAGEIIDSSGNGYHGRLNNSSTPEATSPAITGDPGTCGYANQNDGAIEVTGLPLDTTTNGTKTTITTETASAIIATANSANEIVAGTNHRS